MRVIHKFQRLILIGVIKQQFITIIIVHLPPITFPNKFVTLHKKKLSVRLLSFHLSKHRVIQQFLINDTVFRIKYFELFNQKHVALKAL